MIMSKTSSVRQPKAVRKIIYVLRAEVDYGRAGADLALGVEPLSIAVTSKAAAIENFEALCRTAGIDPDPFADACAEGWDGAELSLKDRTGALTISIQALEVQ